MMMIIMIIIIIYNAQFVYIKMSDLLERYFYTGIIMKSTQIILQKFYF
jgi:hypothetical protein